MALGAQRGSVLQLVLMQGMRLAVIGIVCGAVVALVMGRLFASLLFQVGALAALPWIAAIERWYCSCCWQHTCPHEEPHPLRPMQALRSE